MSVGCRDVVVVATTTTTTTTNATFVPSVLCIYLCVFVLYMYCIVVVLLWAWWGGPDGIEAWSLEPIFLQCFNTVDKVIWPVKTRSRNDL